jgi:hypothetical protein
MTGITDIAVDNGRDLLLTEKGDIIIEETNIKQAIMTRLLWISGEWRLGPSLGFPWFEDVFVKNPNTDRIRSDIREAVMDIDAVNDCTVELVKFDRAQRNITFAYTAYTDEGVISEEVDMDV